MNDQDIRKIVQDEMNKNFRSGDPKTPPHKHDGVDNIQIESSDIVFPASVNGTIPLSQQATYTLNLTGRGQVPSSITFYGGALNTTASPAIHAMIVGSAQFNNNQQFQPSTTTSVVTGPVVTNIIQGSAAMITVNAGATILKNSQGHIVYAEYPSGTLVAVADVISFSESAIKVQVTTLATNWSISGLWIVT